MIAKKSKELDIQLLHVQMNSSSTEFFLPYFRKSLPPLVVTYHLAYASGDSLSTMLFDIAWKLSLFVVKRYDQIVLVDPAQKPYFVKNGITEEKIKVIRNGIDTELFSPSTEEKNDDIIDFVYVGRLSIDKGVNTLVDAFRDYHEENPNSRLTLIGDGMMKFQFKDCIEDGSVCWFGSIEHHQIPRILQKSDVFVIPQNIGGLGLSVLEAMGCGLPIITTAIGETKRLLGKDEGILVEPDNSDAVREAMHILAEDKKLRENMGKNCRDKVVKEYSWSNQISMLEDVYRHVLE
jgi:glycosyltransferase involved in cell wall biosynthesis